MLKKEINKKITIGFFPGCFDFVHAGHCIAFEECKRYCDYLIVGLQTNSNIDRSEKNKPIMSLEERFKMLRANRWIDAVIVYETEKDLIKLESWLPIQFRFRGQDHRGESHYPTKGKFIDIVGDSRFHSSEIRKRICEL